MAALIRKVGAAHLADRGVLDLSGGERAQGATGPVCSPPRRRC